MSLQHALGNTIKQEKVNIHRLFGVAVVLLLVVVAILTARLGIATSNVVSSAPDLSDYALRHPEARIVIPSAPDLSDYALRHPAPAVDKSFPGKEKDDIVVDDSGVSDWFQRHPELRVIVPSVPDLSDYALRHPDARIVIVPTPPDLSDYALRHPELFRH